MYYFIMQVVWIILGFWIILNAERFLGPVTITCTLQSLFFLPGRWQKTKILCWISFEHILLNILYLGNKPKTSNSWGTATQKGHGCLMTSVLPRYQDDLPRTQSEGLLDDLGHLTKETCVSDEMCWKQLALESLCLHCQHCQKGSRSPK